MMAKILMTFPVRSGAERAPEAALAGPVAVLYQALPPPEIDGIRKPAKEGGYADSGADIAFVLRQAGIPVVTPVAAPRETQDRDWVFPDHPAGIAAAQAAGARVLWANTILFAGHPIEAVAGKVLIVGQRPELVQAYDDKWAANARVRQAGCSVPASLLVAEEPADDAIALGELSEASLDAHGLPFPLVVKPLRGRGSQGVCKVDNLPELIGHARALLSARSPGEGGDYPTFGRRLIVEEYLAGDELTVTVMPPGTYQRGGEAWRAESHWTLPAVARFNHQQGIAPYSGVIAIVDNSRTLSTAESDRPEVRQVLAECALAGQAIGSVAPIRIDCRRDAQGRYRLFDVNLKPNMTGAGRAGREKEDSLVCLAARALGWSYPDLLKAMLAQAW
jgi:D-alanine-D-alanine ligase-like ATP-grasp enzyme